MHRPLHGQRAYTGIHVRCTHADLPRLRLSRPRGGAEHRPEQPLRAGHRRARRPTRLFRRDDEGRAVRPPLSAPRRAAARLRRAGERASAGGGLRRLWGGRGRRPPPARGVSGWQGIWQPHRAGRDLAGSVRPAPPHADHAHFRPADDEAGQPFRRPRCRGRPLPAGGRGGDAAAKVRRGGDEPAVHGRVQHERGAGGVCEEGVPGQQGRPVCGVHRALPGVCQGGRLSGDDNAACVDVPLQL